MPTILIRIVCGHPPRWFAWIPGWTYAPRPLEIDHDSTNSAISVGFLLVLGALPPAIAISFLDQGAWWFAAFAAAAYAIGFLPASGMGAVVFVNVFVPRWRRLKGDALAPRLRQLDGWSAMAAVSGGIVCGLFFR